MNEIMSALGVRTQVGIYGKIWLQGLPSGSGHILPYIPPLVLIRKQYCLRKAKQYFYSLYPRIYLTYKNMPIHGRQYPGQAEEPCCDSCTVAAKSRGDNVESPSIAYN